MNRARIGIALVWLLAVHHVAAQGGLTCFFTTDFATYSAEEQVIDVVFTLEAPGSVGQAPLSLTTVLDRSGSMQGNKIELLKKTTQFLVGKLSEAGGKQSLGLVTYSDGVQELSGVLPVSSSNAPLLNNLIATIQAGGQTNLAGGLVRGVEQQKAAPGGKIKSVYLFTDGLPTVGPASTGEILSQVNAARSGGDQITISTFGFGADLDVGLLKGISDAAGGETYIITNEEDIPKAFGDALGGLLSTAAQDITVTLKGEGGASIETLQTGGDVSAVEGGVRVRFSNLFAEEKRDILVKLRIPAGSGKQTVASASVSYSDGSNLQRVNKDPQFVTIDRSGAAPVDKTPEPRVEKTKLRFDTAKALAEAKSKAESGDSAGAATAIATAIANVEVSPVKDDPTIQALLSDVKKIKELLETQGPSSAGKVEELESTLSKQRSSTAGSDLESAKEVDTSKRREIREEARDEVLSAPPVEVNPNIPTTSAGEGNVVPSVEPPTAESAPPASEAASKGSSEANAPPVAESSTDDMPDAPPAAEESSDATSEANAPPADESSIDDMPDAPVSISPSPESSNSVGEGLSSEAPTPPATEDGSASGSDDKNAAPGPDSESSEAPTPPATEDGSASGSGDKNAAPGPGSESSEAPTPPVTEDGSASGSGDKNAALGPDSEPSDAFSLSSEQKSDSTDGSESGGGSGSG